MTVDNAIWLHFSIFYNRKKWNLLLSEAVRPFYISMTARGCLQKILVHLSGEQGENLRLSFKVNRDTATNFLFDADTFFNDYLLTHPSEKNTVFDPNSFLADFPNDSIFYGLHKSSAGSNDENIDSLTENFMNEFSNTIIYTFENEEFSDDSIFTFATYAISGLAAGYYYTCQDLEILTKIISINPVEGFIITAKLDESFEENKIAVSEIMEDVFKLEFSTEASLKALTNWKLFCMKSFEVLSTKRAGDFSMNIFQTVLEKLLFQLGIMNQNKALLLRLITENMNDLNQVMPIQ